MTETSQTNSQWIGEDLARVEVMANELEAHIVANEVYRTVLMPGASGNRKITMSGGDLLARLKRLRDHSQPLSADQKTRFEKAASQAQSTIYSLRTRFHDLLRRELKARSDQLAWNMDVRRARDEKQADPAEIQNRQHIAAIKEELNQA